MRRFAFPVLAALALAGCDQAPKGDPVDPKAYALTLMVEPADGPNLQTLTAPAGALTALRRADRGDIRVFDGRGKALPIALAGPEGGSEKSQTVPVYPILGATGGDDTAKLSITIDSKKVAQVVGVETMSGGKSGGAVLIDTRAVAQPVAAITLDADVPKQQPVVVTLEASANLKDWAFLGEKVLFRPGEDAALLGGGRVDTSSASLRGRYVRASWTGAVVKINSASILSSQSATPVLVMMSAGTPRLANPHELLFSLDLPAHPTALRLTQKGPDGIIPVRLYGRNQEEEAWTLIAAALIRPEDTKPEGSAHLDFSGPSKRQYRIEADQRTSGFSAAPSMYLFFRPTALLVRFNGAPPYSLVAGMAGAPPAYLTQAEIAPAGVPANLPLARVIGGDFVAPDSLTVDDSSSLALARKSILWLVLLLGTAVLGFALYRLMRSPQVADPPL